MPITYTYPADGRGEPITGLSAEQVAVERLTHDGHSYTLLREPGGWCIFATIAPGQGGYRTAYANGKRLFARSVTSAQAFKALAPLIVFADWKGVPTAMTDADYAEMMAETTL